MEPSVILEKIDKSEEFIAAEKRHVAEIKRKQKEEQLRTEKIQQRVDLLKGLIQRSGVAGVRFEFPVLVPGENKKIEKRYCEIDEDGVGIVSGKDRNVVMAKDFILAERELKESYSGDLGIALQNVLDGKTEIKIVSKQEKR